jgi:hypothetical protein
VRYANCSYKIASYFTRTGRRYTGLTDLDEEELGTVLNVDLKPNSDFWTDFFIEVKDRDVIIDTSLGAEEKLKYLFLKGHKNVSVGSIVKAGAEFQLIEAETEAVVSNTRNRLKRRALLEFDKLTPDQMRKALRLYGYSSDNISNEVAESTLSRLVEEDPERFLTIWVDNTNKDIQYLLEEAAANNVIRKSKTVYKYGTDIIGYTLEDAIDYLKNPANQDLKKAILTQLETKGSLYATKKPTSKAIKIEEDKE